MAQDNVTNSLSKTTFNANYSNDCQTTPLLITTGEPAGIGMDIVLMLASAGKLAQFDRPVVVLANLNALQARYDLLLKQNSLSNTIQITPITLNQTAKHLLSLPPLTCRSNALNVIHLPTAEPVQAGILNPANAAMVIAQLDVAHTLANTGQVAAIVTAPLQKSVIMAKLPDFMGHTEYFMQQAGCAKVVMMLANSAMRVALVTTHLPLRAVADAITPSAVRETVAIVLADCQSKFGLKQPRILVCGLNPHAGEDGHLGREEIDIINPVLAEFRAVGVDISLAMPADTLFTRAHLANCDVVIAMYHDQGLAPLKSHGFGETVNITLGLPYIRTSVDHGTALDLAGTGQASASSLYHALQYAQTMADAQRVANI